MVKIKNINIKLDNKIYYLLALVLVVIIINGIVVAFGDYSTGNPAIMGHSSDEMMIKIDNTPTYKTLQQAFDDGDFGGGGTFVTEEYTRNGVGSFTCPNGKTVTGCWSWENPSGANVCGTVLSADGKTCSYGCSSIYRTKIICGGLE